MARFPKDGTPEQLARFSLSSWQDQDAFHNFWIERWKRTMDYIRAIHWRVLQELDTKKIPEWKRFPVVNMTLAFYSDYIAQFLQSRVRFSAVPDSPESSDISSAESADFALRYLWDHLELDAKKIDIAAWLCSTGNADFRVFWNTDTGNMLPLAIPGPDGQLIPVNPETLQPDPSMKEPVMVDAGDIGLEVVPPQLVRTNVKRSMGTMIGYLLNYDEACAKFGDQAAEKLSYNELTGSIATDLLTVFPDNGMPKREPSALVIEHYLPRSSKNPKGLWWSSSNHTVLVQPGPLPISRIPHVHYRWVPVPGHPTLGMSPLYDITFSNKIVDEMTARMLEWLNQVVPKFIRQTGDGLPDGAYSNEPAQEMRVQPGTEPKFLVPPGFPREFMDVRVQAADDSLMVGGYKLRRPKEATPGTPGGFRQPPKALNEGEVTQLAVVNSGPSWQKLGFILLEYAGRFYTEPRMASVVGADRTYQWREFSGSDLANLPKTIHVDELPLYTWNRQSLKDTVIALLGSPAAQVLFAGADGQLDRTRLNAAMEAVGIDVSPDTLDADVMEARNENHIFRALQDGQEPPQVMPWQNNEKHYAEHVVIPKSLEFKAWPKYSQEAFLAHLSDTEQRIAQAQQQAQAGMLEQEKALRTIRAEAEVMQKVRTALGENAAEALMSYLTKEEPKPPKK